MNVKTPEKRVIKGYKIRQSKYNKAMRRAEKNKAKLASLIEFWVESYGYGAEILITPKNNINA